jgi:hypothetical protein
LRPNFESADLYLDDDFKTVSGYDIGESFQGHYTKYRDAFTSAIGTLEPLGYEIDLPRILTNADRAQYLFDVYNFTDGDDQYAHIGAFGLVLFDRLCRMSASNDAGYFFELHEELFECYRILSESDRQIQYSTVLADKRHAPAREAKAFVVGEWKQHGDAYKGNKSDFSRHYVRRVLAEFNVRITEKQMREVWLKDNPVAADD